MDSKATEIENFAMNNCLMILSTQAAAAAAAAASAAAEATNASGGASVYQGRMFSCKICGKEFNSFQALGGHRASHSKIKPLGASSSEAVGFKLPKSHACPTCGLEFPTGQALGGHMRRHRPSPAACSTSPATSDVTADDIESMKRKNNVDCTASTLGCNKRVRLTELNLLTFSPHQQHQDQHQDEKVGEIEEGEIGGKADEEDEEIRDLLNLELRPPINKWPLRFSFSF